MNWRRSLAAGAVALPFVALLGFGLTRDPRAIPSPLPGRSAPEFRLAVLRPGDYPPARIARDTAALSELRGQIVVLNFWASWCLACRDEHAALSAVAREYAGQGVQFFGPLYNDTPASAARWIEGMGGQAYPSLLDPGSRTAIDYGLYGVPETFFIGRDGRVAYKHVGPVTEALLRRKIDSLRAASAGP
ncbi:MAG: redoxin domain-containing protein [Gemmatimonadota bacterium]|nr:redoxin domain-containing protein [Gemmatimonadota bacterium]